MKSLWDEISVLLIEADRIERQAGDLLAFRLPPGTRVLFKFGSMAGPTEAAIMGTEIWGLHPRVHLRNWETAKDRWVPLEAIKEIL